MNENTEEKTRATEENSGVCIFNVENGKMCRKKLKPRYPGLNALVSVNELLFFRPHRGDQTKVGKHIGEKMQSNKSSSVKANEHNVNQWLEVRTRQIQIRIGYPLVNTKGD